VLLGKYIICTFLILYTEVIKIKTLMYWQMWHTSC